MSEVKLDNAQKEAAIEKLKRYFQSEMNQELGGFEAEFLLDFIDKEISPYFYNQGLQDAGKVMEQRLEDIQQHLYELEKPTY